MDEHRIIYEAEVNDIFTPCGVEHYFLRDKNVCEVEQRFCLPLFTWY